MECCRQNSKKIFNSHKNWFIEFLEVSDYEFAIKSEKFCMSNFVKIQIITELLAITLGLASCVLDI